MEKQDDFGNAVKTTSLRRSAKPRPMVGCCGSIPMLLLLASNYLFKKRIVILVIVHIGFISYQFQSQNALITYITNVLRCRKLKLMLGVRNIV